MTRIVESDVKYDNPHTPLLQIELLKVALNTITLTHLSSK
jgi:hypothetical protein